MPKCDSLNDCYEQARFYYKKPDGMLKPIRSCTIIYQVFKLHTPQGLLTERGGVSGGSAALIPPGWKLDRTEVVIPGRIVLAVIQDRYSTIGLLSVYLHPQTKVVELKELITWVKTSRVDFPLYMGGDFNQVDASCPDLWNELLVHAQVLDTHPQLHTFESPTGSSALDRVLCPTDYIAAAQIDVMVAANRRTSPKWTLPAHRDLCSSTKSQK